MSKRVNRCLAALLAAVMVFTSADFSVFAAGTGSGENWTASAAEIVAEHNGFSGEAKAVTDGIKCDVTYTSAWPKEAQVDIELDTKTVTAYDYTSGEHTWKASEAVVVAEGTEGTPFDLIYDEANKCASASFHTDAENYSVKVTYELKVAVDTAEQQRIINVYANLHDGVANLEALNGMQTAVNTAISAVNDVKGAVEASGDAMVQEYWNANGAPTAEAAAEAMNAFLNAIEAYAGENCVAFMLDTGAYGALETAVKDCHTDVRALADAFVAMKDTGFESIIGEYADALTAVVNAMAPYAELETWPAVAASDLAYTEGEAWTAWQAKVLAFSETSFTAPEAAAVLTAAEYEVSADVAMCAVDVIVKANVAAKEITLGEEADQALETVEVSMTVKFPENTSREFLENGIGQAVEALTADDALKDYDLASENYVKDESENTLPDVITEGFDYVVTYTPVKHAVSDEAYYHGTTLVLPKHADGEMSYDYAVTKDGAASYYNQGDKVVVDEPLTIVCYEGAFETDYTIGEIYAQSLSGSAKSIMANNAVTGEGLGEKVSFSVPGEAVVGTITGSAAAGYRVSMEAEYRSGLKDEYWSAYQVRVVGKDGKDITTVGVTADPEDAERATASWNTDKEIDKIFVVYRLIVKTGEQVAAWNDLPAQIVALVQTQDDLMDTAQLLYNKINDFSEINSKIALRKIGGELADPSIVEDITKAASEGGCWANGGSGLAIYDYLSKCVDNTDDKIRVTEYFRSGNGAQMAEQAERLGALLERLEKDAKLDDALKNNGVENTEEARAKLQDLKGYLGELEALEDIGNLPVDTKATGFAALIETAKAAEDVAAGTGDTVYAYHEVQKNTPGTVTVRGAVKIGNRTYAGKGFDVAVGLGSTYELVESDKDAIAADISAAEAENLSEGAQKYYSVKEAVVPETISGDISVVTVTKTYTPYHYTVKTENGKELADFTYGGENAEYTVELPAPTEEGIMFVYTVNGVEKEVTYGENPATYTFTNQDLIDLFGTSRTYTVACEETTPERKNLEDYIEALNESLAELKDAEGNLFAAFLPVEKDGEYTGLVLRILSTKGLDNSKIMDSLMSAFTALTYDYVGVEGADGQTGLLYMKDNNGTSELKMNPQALLDVMLNGGITTDSLLGILNADGTMVEFAPAEGTVDKSLIDGGKLGGLFAQNKLYLGNSADDCTALDLYVTMAVDNAEMVKTLRKSLSDSSTYITFAFENGAANITGIIPEREYKLFLSVMVLLGEKNLDNLEANLQEDVQLLVDIMKPFFEKKDEVSVATFEETLKRAGFDYELTQYRTTAEWLLERIVNALDEQCSEGIKFTGENENELSFTITCDVNELAGKAEQADIIESMLEPGAKLVFPFKIVVENYGKSYEAIVLDTSKSGIAKLNYVESLADALNTEGEVYALLLTDINDNLTVKNATILNLNGKNIHGNVYAKAGLRIVDSQLDPDAQGLVTGDIYAEENVTVGVAGGKYDQDVTEFLRAGYIQKEDGSVANKYYDVEVDDNGNIDIILATEFADLADSEFRTLASELVSDVLFNMHTSAMAAVDGKELYDVNIENLLTVLDANDRFSALKEDLIDSVNRANMEDAISDLADSLNAKTLADALGREDLVIASYEFTDAPWKFEIDVQSDGGQNYIGVGVKSGEQEKHTVTLKFDKKDADLRAMFLDIYEIVSVKNAFALGDVTFTEDKRVEWTGSWDVEVTIDMESKDGTSSDYVTVLAAVLAYYSDDRAAYTDDIRFYEENYYGENLKKRIEAMTVQELLDACIRIREEGLTYVEIVQALDIPEYLTEAVRLEHTYETLLQCLYGFAERFDAAVPADASIRQNTLDGTFKESEDAYCLTWERAVLTGGKVGVTVKLKLFAEDYVSSVQEVIDLIDEIPELSEIYDPENGVDNREEYIDIIADAREAYNSLTEEQKKLVDNYWFLEAAEDLYADKKIWLGKLDEYYYQAVKIKPVIKVYEGANRLKVGKDYTVSFYNNVNRYILEEHTQEEIEKSAPRIDVKLKGNYTGTYRSYFTIHPVNLSRCREDYEYKKAVGLAINTSVFAEPSKSAYAVNPGLFLNGVAVPLDEYVPRLWDTEFTHVITRANEMPAGRYQVVISGNYSKYGTADKMNITGSYGFKGGQLTAQIVGSQNLKDVTVTGLADQVYTGEEITLSGLKLKYKGNTLLLDTPARDGHYTATYVNNTEIGTAKITLRGTGKTVTHSNSKVSKETFTGTKVLTFKITGETLHAKNITVNSAEKIYTGYAYTLEEGEYKVTNSRGEVLTENVDYTVSYKNNTNAGNATVTFKGIGAYTGSAEKTFAITARQLEEEMIVTASTFRVVYQKGGVKPSDRIRLSYDDKTLAEGKDYTITWKNNDQVGTASYVVKGKGNFQGSIPERTFTIMSSTLNAVKMSADNVLYKANTKNNFKGSVRLRDANNNYLTAGVDYSKSLKYWWNTEVITGSENWISLRTGQTIEEAALQVIKAAHPNWSTNRCKTELGRIGSFDLKVRVTGMGAYEGSVKEKEYRIFRTDVSELVAAKAGLFSKTYSGQPKTQPKFALTQGDYTLEEGVDYTLTYSNNVDAGTATIKVTGLGTYGGVKTYTFKILPKAM